MMCEQPGGYARAGNRAWNASDRPNPPNEGLDRAALNR